MVLTTLGETLGIESADDTTTDEIGFAKKGVCSIYLATVAADTGGSIFDTKLNATCATPRSPVNRSDNGGHGVDSHGIGTQLTDVRNQLALIKATSYAGEAAVARHGGDVVLCAVKLGQRPTQSNTELATAMQGNGLVVQLVGVGYGSTICVESSAKGDIVVEHPSGYNKLHPRLLKDVGLIPTEEAVAGWNLGDWTRLAMDREAHLRTVAQGIAQGIDEMIGALFINQYPSAVGIGGMEQTEAIARVDDRLHIGAVGPGVDVTLFCLRKAIHHTAEYFPLIDGKYHGMYTQAIVNALHVVVRTNAGTYPAPGGEGLLWLWGKAFGLGATHHNAFTLQGKEHDTIGTGGGMVVDGLGKEGQRVDVVTCCALEEVEVEVRTKGIAGVSTHSNHLTRLNRILFGAADEFNLPILVMILQLFYAAGGFAYEGVEVAVDSRVTVVIDDIKHVA